MRGMVMTIRANWGYPKLFINIKLYNPCSNAVRWGLQKVALVIPGS
jgi:hypothetical protein